MTVWNVVTGNFTILEGKGEEIITPGKNPATRDHSFALEIEDINIGVSSNYTFNYTTHLGDDEVASGSSLAGQLRIHIEGM